MTVLLVPGDVIVTVAGDGRWLLYNVRLRTSVGVDQAGAALFGDAPGRTRDDLAGRHGRSTTWETGAFTNTDGLLADPTRVRRPDWGEARTVDAAALVDLLLESGLLIDDDAAYAARFGPKTSIIDRTHAGNFHQQLGQHLMLERRIDPDEWWLDQKFAPDQRSLRRNLYAAVQEPMIQSWIDRRLAGGMTLLDLGCGTGYYTSMFAASGASVTGVDPTPRFLDIARERATSGEQFELGAVGEPGGLDHLPSDGFDVVFMSDALLFYFVSPSDRPRPDIDVLLADVHRILRPGGHFVSVEPHHLFWLTPWLGDVDRPFTVLSEYTKRSFRVTSTQSELIQALGRNGLGVTWMEEALPEDWYEAIDPRGYRFASEFPLWQLYEVRAL